MIEHGTPNLITFRPLPQQLQIITDIRRRFDYSKGTHEILLSGSVGSSKSITLAHAVCTHCIIHPRSRVGIGRLALPQLKATLCQKIREHLFEAGVEYRYDKTTGDFQIGDSEIKAISWADGNLAKLGSMEFSAFAIEELTETKNPEPYDVILQRVNRLPHVNEPWVLSATNPDSPAHWAYKKIITSQSPNVKVYYSNTFDNPYLPPNYIETLKERLDERMAQRMIYGKWIEVNDGSLVYYTYSRDNFVKGKYKINPRYPIRLTWDFNIGEGKPLSLVLGQYLEDLDEWHWFAEIIVDGQRTLDSLEELEARGYLSGDYFYKIHGDATGRNRDTRSIKSDYEIIENFLANYRDKQGRVIRYAIEVPKANPALRTRHNIVNGYMKNTKGQVKFFVYEDAKTVDEGCRLTKLKSGGQHLEDDSDRFQHCTTAVGYAVMYVALRKAYNESPSFGQGRY